MNIKTRKENIIYVFEIIRELYIMLPEIYIWNNVAMHLSLMTFKVLP